jgi:hypothetical protein
MERKIRAMAVVTALLLLVGVVFTVEGAGNPEKGKILPTKTVEKNVTVKKPSLDELRKDNAEHIKFLRKNLKPNEAGNVIGTYFRHLAEKIEKQPDIATVKVKLVQVGENTITFWAYTNDAPSFTDPVDPINLIFYGVGSAWDVQYDMKNWLDYTWEDATGWTHYAYIDNTEHGGTADWRSNDYQLQYGSYFTSRYHLRIFDGGTDTHGDFDEYSIANVHHEYWDWSELNHIVDGYESAETFVKDDFADENFVGSIGSAGLNNEGSYSNGAYNDGWAATIELLN